MSFGAISEEAARALGQGAEIAGTGVCPGEGGMLPNRPEANSRYLYEPASGWFGWDPAIAGRVQALHFNFGQGAKTGTGGYLPGAKVTGRIAEIRGLAPGTPAASPARFPDWDHSDLRAVAEDVRTRSGGIPIGAKLSAQHVEDDIDAALGADAIAIANSALQAIGCVGMRACHTDNCPVGIATQKPHLRARLPVDEAAERLARHLGATVELMRVLARACGHRHLGQFSPHDLTTFDREMARLSGIPYGVVTQA